jgi:hypothetical protein
MDASTAASTSHRASRPISRRAVLLGSGVAVIAAGGGGVGYGLLRPVHHTDAAASPPADLVAALAGEGALIERIDAAVAHDPSLHRVLAGVRADHVAHQTVLQAAVAAYAGAPGPSTSAPTATPTTPATELTRAGLREREVAAGTLAAARALRLTGRDATVLASIAASEASHAELLR